MIGCKRCSRCCKYNMFDLWQFKGDLDYLNARGGILAPSKKRALIPSLCPKLDRNNNCTVNDAKPFFCRDYPGRKEDCDMEWVKDFGCRYFEE